MQKQLVITLTGNDRVGLVDDVTKIILTHSGNIDASRMARLGGEFAMLMLVSVAKERIRSVQAAFNQLRDQGFELAIRATTGGTTQQFTGWGRHQIAVGGADHEGIIHEITHLLAEHGVSVETMDTGTEDAPFGGTKLFVMSGVVLIPPSLTTAELEDALDAAAHRLNVDVDLVVSSE